jgi:hypothetical protein
VCTRKAEVIESVALEFFINGSKLLEPPNSVNWSISLKCGKMTISKATSDVRTKCNLYNIYLSAWKVVQMTQPEFVDSQIYFDALVLKYLS